MQKLSKDVKMISVKFYKEDLDFILGNLKKDNGKLSTWLREYLHKQLEKPKELKSKMNLKVDEKTTNEFSEVPTFERQ